MGDALTKSGRRAAPTRASRRRRPGGSSSRTRVPAAGVALPRRLAPRKTPRQRRSCATVEAIVEAAVDLLSTRGYVRTSTNRIAARAGVSVGSVYQYFPNKDAIVAVVFERHGRGIEQILETTLADLRRPEVPVRDAFSRMLLGFQALHDADPKLARAADPQADGGQPFGAIAREREERAREELADVLRRRPDVRRGSHAIMASLLFDIGEAVTRSLMHGDARRFEPRQAIEEATEAICRYVEARPRSAAGDCERFR